jgi:hypothetical protein
MVNAVTLNTNNNIPNFEFKNNVVMAMERSENEDSSAENGMNQLLWQHLSSQVIYFVLFQFASFPHMVMSLS